MCPPHCLLLLLPSAECKIEVSNCLEKEMSNSCLWERVEAISEGNLNRLWLMNKVIEESKKYGKQAHSANIRASLILPYLLSQHNVQSAASQKVCCLLNLHIHIYIYSIYIHTCAPHTNTHTCTLHTLSMGLSSLPSSIASFLKSRCVMIHLLTVYIFSSWRLCQDRFWPRARGG